MTPLGPQSRELGPVATRMLCDTWARILEERHPELGRIEVSVVERDEKRRPGSAGLRQSNVVVLPDDLQAAGERRDAA